MGTPLRAEPLSVSAQLGSGVRATGTKPSQGQMLHLLLPCRERFGDYELAIMEHSGLSKCFPIIKSVPAVKALVKMHASYWVGPGASAEEGSQPEIDGPCARVADFAQHGWMS